MLVAKCKTRRLLNFAFCRPASKERLQLKRIGYVSLFMTLTKNVIKDWVAPRYTHCLHCLHCFHCAWSRTLFSLFKQFWSKKAIWHIWYGHLDLCGLLGKKWRMLSTWMDTPQTVRTIRAPAVLKIRMQLQKTAFSLVKSSLALGLQKLFEWMSPCRKLQNT